MKKDICTHKQSRQTPNGACRHEMDKKFALEILKRLCFSFTDGTIIFGMPVTTDGDVMTVTDSEEEIAAALESSRLEAMRDHCLEEILRELVQPYGEYAHEPRTQSDFIHEDAQNYLKEIWKRLYTKYVDAKADAEAKFNENPFACKQDISADIFELMNYAYEHSVPQLDVYQTMTNAA